MTNKVYDAETNWTWLRDIMIEAMVDEGRAKGARVIMCDEPRGASIGMTKSLFQNMTARIEKRFDAQGSALLPRNDAGLVEALADCKIFIGEHVEQNKRVERLYSRINAALSHTNSKEG